MVIAIAGVLFSGVTIVLARMCNARLAQECSVHYSSLVNYITGLMGSLVMFLILGATANAAFPAQGGSIAMYLGGALGLVSVYAVNIIAHKLPATQLTLLIFAGQMFSGLVFDYFLTHKFSMGTLLGGLIVLLGLTLNILSDKRAEE